ncbi:aminotransferase class III-fold pyridoxal phosphate-dependent enzyme [Pandoraea sp.]|uniref:aminotransferase class III-fold pyridoxal phosphate-dependent enzyme n=1 Tax=Pandoraea sp. TaxID=1883445 RepID=UPI001206DFAF|nr:aminotransferase class III-fold pyridoxal phosphate-dependent enzyme [Pandoraea sp.]TAL56220.1 MAG: aminotransferase class III-fold pyridoxal phosphate-dependent enzyme [Pandoraea sp.]TAM19174.1 MAG: aminotransferase class III-fold pyridoxal phosphate-dependent enzyme [Pandoraea sp.]
MNPSSAVAPAQPATRQAPPKGAAHESAPPPHGGARRSAWRSLASASGMTLCDGHGRSVLDATAGSLAVPAGHSRATIAAAVGRQLGEWHDSTARGASHPMLGELTRRLLALAPDGMERVQFSTTPRGSLEQALRVCVATHAARGEHQRTIVITDQPAAAGLSLATLRPGSNGRRVPDNGLGAGLLGFVQLPHPRLAENRFVKGQPDHGDALADEFTHIVELFGAAHIAACVIEPVGTANGIQVPPRNYLETLQTVCHEHGIPLVFDESSCGMGHTGAALGALSLGVTPDLLVLGNALTNGTLPLGALLIGERVCRALGDTVGAPADDSAHPLYPAAGAAALAMLDLCEQEALFERAQQLSPAFLDQVFALSDLPVVRDIQGFGLLAGLEIDSGAAASRHGAHVAEVQRRLFEADLNVLARGDTLLLAPGLVMTPQELDQMCRTLRSVLTDFS